MSALAAGVIGNAAWDWAVQPAAEGLRDLALNVASFGLAGLKDMTYREIARNRAEVVALEHHRLLLVLILLPIVWFALWAHDSIRRGRRTLAAIQTDLERVARGDPTPLVETTPEAILGAHRADASSLARRLGRVATWAYLAMAVNLTLLVTWHLRAVQLQYISTATAYYQSLARIAEPLMTPEQRSASAAAFATISTRHDYVSVVTALKERATAHSLPVPTFSVW